jgi:hypothetical protein
MTKNNPPVGSGGFDSRQDSLSSSGACPDFRPNHITPIAKDYDLNKANDDDRNNTYGKHCDDFNRKGMALSSYNPH